MWCRSYPQPRRYPQIWSGHRKESLKGVYLSVLQELAGRRRGAASLGGRTRTSAGVGEGWFRVQATALQSLETDVRELIRRRRLDPATDDPQVRQLVAEAVAEYDERALLGGMPPLADQDEAGRVVLESVAGFGPLQPYLDDPSVEEIWINEPSRVFVARHGRSELTSTFLTEQQVHHLVERMLRSSGRRVDLSAPFVDASMPDGSRLHVVIPDITRRHWAVNIRKFVVAADELDDLVRLGTLTASAARFLAAAVGSGLNILVAGGTQAGKTTMLNCLAAAIPAQERVVTCEEVFELPQVQ